MAEKMKLDIYFHVGLGKVASTYLQYQFFPKLKGIYYIQRTKYRRYQKVISHTQQTRYLLSREFDNQLEEEVAEFSKYYPQAKIIILFRRHDGWIASQYRRYVKNGGYRSFSSFFDVEHDKGLWKKNQVYFMPKIEILERYFEAKPLVLFHEELKQNPYNFFDKIAAFTGSTYEKGTISLESVHKSYSEKQLKFIRSVANNLFQEPYETVRQTGVKHWLQRRSKMLACYATMYTSNLLPETLIGTEPLIPKVELQNVADFFAKDWQRLHDYASKNNSK